ncbi:MAG TPA: NADH-quinone oxidoreductase subunit NuoH [Thermoanaerobaculia bacterium]|nr:NADH-quinone oxidoreductase subunit NuoH [Thermoanaerobaculia bacterium]
MNVDVSILVTVVKLVVVLVLLLQVAPIMIWVERRGSALMQDRPGPNRLGPFGLFQGLADAVKFMFKEDVTPTLADKPLYLMAPVLALLPAFTTSVVIPWGPNFTWDGEVYRFIIADVDMGVLLFLSLASLGVYSLVMAGYASNNKFSLLGSIRATAQLISYELAMTVAVLAVVIPVGSFHLGEVVEYQRTHVWNFIPQFLGFVVFAIAAFAETNRLPFDLPEAESELVAGFHTEYSAMRFAAFFMAEYTSMAALSALGVTLYFGGWSLPWVDYEGLGWLGVLLGLATLMAKVAACMFFFVWVRWTFPRFRYDQLMRLGWKVLLPVAIFNLIAVAAMTLAGWL